MKIVKFLGGLGNQMFQYAFYKALSNKYKSVKADISGYKTYPLHNGLELENIFNISLNKASDFRIGLYDSSVRSWHMRKLRSLLGLKKAYVEERKPFCFDAEVFQDSDPRLYWGYWQNQDYFLDIEDQIKRAFQFKKPLNIKNSSYLQEIQQSNSISIHVRRGDYLKEEFLGGVCSIDYYQNAIEYIVSKVSSPSFFIFSDDISWCKENLNLNNYPKTFITGNEGINSFIDMQLMSNCKHNIIANSSFSWWGAWLNNNPDEIVIAPHKWINGEKYTDLDIIPKTWLKI